MEQKPRKPMTAFDELITTDELQMMKVMIPYTPASGQRILAFMAKFMELKTTMEYFENFHSDLRTQGFNQETSSPSDMMEEMRPYMGEKNAETFDMMMNMMSMMDMFSSYQDMAETMGNMDGAGPMGGMGSINPMDMMKTMLTPEQQEMFDMYSTMFNQEGDDNNGGMDEPSGDEEHRSGETGTD